jgi:hypothetical protein
MSGRRWFKPLLVLLAVGALILVGPVQRALNRDRAALGLTQAAPLENAPPVLAFTTVALGGFRGIIANLLWMRTTELQEQGKYFETAQLADWITKLQPRFVTIWVYQSWNMVYNISIKFRDPPERWLWVKRGIELLRDQAIVYNPHEGMLYRELGWFFQHKMGYILDDAHMFYKRSWAAEFTEAVGPVQAPFEDLIRPGTEDARTRSRRLREEFKMNPEAMRDVDARWGPLDWRLPETHAIYWASVGMQQSRRTNDLPFLRRVIYQSLQTAFRRGRVVSGPRGELRDIIPNLDLAAKVSDTYDRMAEEEPQRRDGIGTAHQNFLKDVVYFLYVYNRRAEAARWFETLRQRYPGAVDAWVDLDTFAVERVTEQIERSSMDQVRAILLGTLTTAYVSLAMGETDRYTGYEALAQRVWQKHQAKFANDQGRVGLPSLGELKQIVLDDLLDAQRGLLPELQAQLRSALNLPAGTNAPALPQP